MRSRFIEKLIFTNSNGSSLTFSVRSVFHVNISKDVSGLSDVENDIFSTSGINQAGATYLGYHIESRDIEIVGHINERDKSVIREYLNPWVISGYFLLAVSTICVIYAFKGVDFKNGPVIESLGFPLVMILGRIFYGEKLTKNKLVGMGLIMLGVVVYYI